MEWPKCGKKDATMIVIVTNSLKKRRWSSFLGRGAVFKSRGHEERIIQHVMEDSGRHLGGTYQFRSSLFMSDEEDH